MQQTGGGFKVGQVAVGDIKKVGGFIFWPLIGCLLLLTPASAKASPLQQTCLDTCGGLLGLQFVTCMNQCRGEGLGLHQGAAETGFAPQWRGETWRQNLMDACPPGQDCPLLPLRVYPGGKDIAQPCAQNPRQPGCHDAAVAPPVFLSPCGHDYSRFLSGSVTLLTGGLTQHRTPPGGQRLLWVESGGLGMAVDLPLQGAPTSGEWPHQWPQREYLVQEGAAFSPQNGEVAPVAGDVAGRVKAYPYAPHAACFCPTDCALNDPRRDYCPTGFFSPSTGQCCPNHCR